MTRARADEAQECLDLAREISLERDRAVVLDMAQSWLKQFVELGRALGNQTSALTAVAVRLRLTHSSRFTRQHAAIDAVASSGPKPWTDWGERARKRDEDDDKPN